jgi:putative phosphoribosyl transferase
MYGRTPRAGVPVAFEVANALNAPLDVFVVRKLGVPEHEELAMGATASGKIRVLSKEIINALAIPTRLIEHVTSTEQREVQRRERRYRPMKTPPVLEDKTVILGYDGLATGSTMRAAVLALRQRNRRALSLPFQSLQLRPVMNLKTKLMRSCALGMPEPFFSVSQCTVNFHRQAM